MRSGCATRWPRLAFAVVLAIAGVGRAQDGTGGTDGGSIDDPRWVKAMILLEGGDPGAAVRPLEELAAERAGALYVLDEHFEGERERRERLSAELALLEAELAIAEHRRGREDAALAHLARLLDIDPDARLDPLEVSRPLLLKLEELRTARTVEATPERFELPLGPVEGIEHAPPLVVVRGSPATIYARVDDGAADRVMLDHCAPGPTPGSGAVPPCDTPRRQPMEALGAGLFAGTISGADTLEARALRYRIGVTDARGRLRSSPWFPLAVADDVNQHAAAAAGRYGPRAESRIRAARVVERLAPPAPWPQGVREIDSRGSAMERYREPY